MEELDQCSTNAKTLQLLSDVKQQGQLVQEMKDTETRSVYVYYYQTLGKHLSTYAYKHFSTYFEVHSNIFVFKHLCLWSGYYVEQLFSMVG